MFKEIPKDTFNSRMHEFKILLLRKEYSINQA